MFGLGKSKGKDGGAGGKKAAKNADNREMLANVIEFSGLTVDDMAVHRRDMTAISVDAQNAEVMKILLESQYSRFPVYRGNVDDIVGLLYAKDAFRALVTVEDGVLGVNPDFDLKRLLRKPYCVPVSKSAAELFDEMRQNKAHMAVVVDEYGGTAGIVTLEDLIEEITGDIKDEYDAEEPQEIAALGQGKFAVLGHAPLEDLEDALGVSLPESEFDTAGGFMVGQLGHIPENGESVAIPELGLTMTAAEVEDNRVKKLSVEIADDVMKNDEK